MQYRYVSDGLGGVREGWIQALDDSGLLWSVPADVSNLDWQSYQAWLAADPENNVPLQADE